MLFISVLFYGSFCELSRTFDSLAVIYFGFNKEVSSAFTEDVVVLFGTNSVLEFECCLSGVSFFLSLISLLKLLVTDDCMSTLRCS